MEVNMQDSSNNHIKPGARLKYVPPVDVVAVDSSDIGIKDGLLLRFPRMYAVGDLELLKQAGVAIVGARKATDDGRRRAARLARELIESGIVIISGLALGIDEVAHEAALALRGKTIAVIGTPVDRAYPNEHAMLQRKIYRRGLLLSPFAVGTRTYPSHFPERNRVMARIARASVIVEASDTSGSLHQAVECVNIGRPLFIAKSVVDNSALKWPRKFIGYPNVFVLASTAEILDKI